MQLSMGHMVYNNTCGMAYACILYIGARGRGDTCNGVR